VIGGILAAGRRRAESLMRDTCRITRPGANTWDEATMTYTPSTTAVYEGRCRFLNPYRAPTTANTPGQSQVVQLARLSLPVATSAGIREGDVVEYLTSASDPDMVGLKFKVIGGAHQSDATARRVPVEEVS
jgi:hypothetical protein